MDKGTQGYIDLSDLGLTSCHFKGDVISKVSSLSSNLQHVTFKCKEIGGCNFTIAIVDNVIFRYRRLHSVIFIKASDECVDLSKNILDIVDSSQNQLGHNNFRERQIRNSSFDNCYLYTLRFARAKSLPVKEVSFIKSNLTAAVSGYMRVSTGNLKNCITEQLELTIDYSGIFWNEGLDGYINNVIKTVDTLPNNAMVLRSVLIVKLVMQLKIFSIANKNFIENMKKILSHCPHTKDPIIRSYIHSDEDNEFDDFMRQHRFNEVNFDIQQVTSFINRFNTNKWLVGKNNNFFIQLIDQALQSTDDMVRADVWRLYEERIRSDDVSPILIKTEDNLRTFNTNELTRNGNIFILLSSVDDGPVMMVNSQRLHDTLNPTKDINWGSTYVYKPRYEMLPVNLTQETLFSFRSHGKYTLFPIFAASWRAHRIMNKGAQVEESITVPGILDGDVPTVTLTNTGIDKA